jgi:hypothetical protein
MANLAQKDLDKALKIIARVEASRDENLSNYKKEELILPEVEIRTVRGERPDSRLREVTIGNKTLKVSLGRGADESMEVGELWVVKARKTEQYEIAGRKITVPEGVLNYRLY